jgi:hypothetical protein
VERYGQILGVLVKVQYKRFSVQLFVGCERKRWTKTPATGRMEWPLAKTGQLWNRGEKGFSFDHFQFEVGRVTKQTHVWRGLGWKWKEGGQDSGRGPKAIRLQRPSRGE